MLERYRRCDPARKAFFWGLVAITAAGWAWRIVFILNWRRGFVTHNDGEIYHRAANLLADGEGFIDPLATIDGRPRQAANSPPLYLVWLAVASTFGQTSWLAHLLWTSVLGAATVAVIGLTGREIANARVGLIAALLAAVDPQMWWWNGVLFTESMALLALSVAILLAYRYWRVPSGPRAAWLGLSVGLAAMSRAELALLFPLVVIPLVLLTRDRDPAQRWRWVATSALVVALPIAPWVTYNMFRFEHPVTFSTSFELTLAASNCDQTYEGAYLGYWSIQCVLPITEHRLGHRLSPLAQLDRGQEVKYDQSEEAQVFREAAVEYVGDHLDRLPVVVVARWGRVTQLWKPAQTLTLAQFPEGMERWVAQDIVYGFYVLAALAALGVVVLRRRRVPVFVLLAAPATVMVVTAITFANLRYRATAEPPLVLLAAVAIDAVSRSGARRWRRRGSP